MDWLNFLEGNRIAYDTRGKNVSGNHVAIACPWCGSEDPSRHLVISLNGAGWHCWRKHQHRGRSAIKLICALLHCSVDQARAIAGERNPIVPESLTDMVNSVMQPDQIDNQPLDMPGEFKAFRGQYSSRRFSQYLHSRKFPTPVIAEMTKTHDIYYAMTGPFFGRVLFMVHSSDGDLMAWSGRSIYPSEKLRYKTEGPTGDYLLWLDRLPRPRSHTLVLCEGPMDALKVSVFGKSLGIDATCCFTSTPTRRQIDHLYQLRPRYKNLCIMLDQGEVANTLWTADALAPLNGAAVWLTPAHKDPGEISSSDELRQTMGLVIADKIG